MAPTSDQVQKETAEMVEPLEQGDTYDEESGKFLGSLELEDDLPPAQISVLVKGYWYVYKPDARYKVDPVTTATQDLKAEIREVAVELEKDHPPVIPAEDSIFPKG